MLIVSYIVILTKDGIYVIFFVIYTVIFFTTQFSLITLAPALALALELPITGLPLWSKFSAKVNLDF